MENNYYDLLGINRNANQEDIKYAYRRAASKYHPDKNSDPSAVEMFKKIASAYDTLSDQSKRREYDANLGRKITIDIKQPDIKKREKTAVHTLVITLEQAYSGETIETSFGRIPIPAGCRHNTKIMTINSIVIVLIEEHKYFKRDNDDLFVVINPSVFDCMFGNSVSLSHVSGNKLLFDIPENTQPLDKIRLKGKGMYNSAYKVYGDLFITVIPYIPNSLTDEQKANILSLKSESPIQF